STSARQGKFQILLALVVDLQPKLDFARIIALAREVPEAAKSPREGVALQDRVVLIATLVRTQNRAIEDIQEVRPKFNRHSFSDASLFEQGDILVQVCGQAETTVRARSVAERSPRRVAPGVKVQQSAAVSAIGGSASARIGWVIVNGH